MKAVLEIGGWRSTCLNCGAGADPRAPSHTKILEYSDRNGQPGCGVTWTHLTTEHYGLPDEEESAREMRPDLEWDDRASRSLFFRAPETL